jgi:hypothetical protein
MFTKGNHQRRPSEVVPLKLPGDRGFDWTKDAFALRLGAVYESPNRYRYGGQYVNHLGQFIDAGTCRYCGGTPYFVQVDMTKRGVGASADLLQPLRHASDARGERPEGAGDTATAGASQVGVARRL